MRVYIEKKLTTFLLHYLYRILETLYLIDIQAIGGERGIRTLDGLLTHTPLAGERFRPLSQLSEI